MYTVFVYGTLKRGCGNAWMMEDVGAKFIGTDEAPGVVYGPFPRAKPEDGWIKGEVYEVDGAALEQLDRFEGHPRHYVRTSVTLRSGRPADMYYYVRPVTESYGNYRCAEGEWCERSAKAAL